MVYLIMSGRKHVNVDDQGDFLVQFNAFQVNIIFGK